MDHATDALIEVEASDLNEAFAIAAKSVIETILDSDKVEEKDERQIIVKGKDLSYLLYNWLEELIILTLTDGFAWKDIRLELKKNSEYEISATLKGEEFDFKKHNFKVEIKSPTFHLMEINQNKRTHMQFLLDL